MLHDPLSQDCAVDDLFSLAEEQVLEIVDHDFYGIELGRAGRKEDVPHAVPEKGGFYCGAV